VLRNVPSAGFPGGCHTLLAHDCLFTDRATVVESREFPETVGVNGVSARQVLWRLRRTCPRRREVVLATQSTGGYQRR
jgi:hypothetical protein